VWLTLLGGALSLGRSLARIAHDRQLLEAGAAKAIARQATTGLAAVAAAQAARRSVGHDAVSVRDDPDNRD